MSHPALCLFCLAALANGSPVSSPECDEGWWKILPTLDGDIYADSDEVSDAGADWRPGPDPAWRCLEAAPKPEEAASWEDRAYISGDRLRGKL